MVVYKFVRYLFRKFKILEIIDQLDIDFEDEEEEKKIATKAKSKSKKDKKVLKLSETF